MSNPGNSKPLRIKLRDPVEGGKKTFGTVGMEREKHVASGAKIGSAVVGSRTIGKWCKVSGSETGVGLSRVAGVKSSVGARVSMQRWSRVKPWSRRLARGPRRGGERKQATWACCCRSRVSEECIDVKDGVNVRISVRREIIESWSDDVEASNNVNICPTVDEMDSSRRRYGRQVVDFGSDSDDSNRAPLASDHAVPSSELEPTDEEEEEDDIPPGDVGIDTGRQKKNKPINLDLVNFDSVLTEEHLHSIRRLSGAPSNVELLLPQKGDRLYSPPDGFHTVFLGYLTCTSQITPHPTLLKVCEEFKIGYSQLNPTVVLMFEAFHYRVVRVGLPVTVSLFKALFTLHRPNKMPFFCFHPRVPYQFLKSVKLSLGEWKTHFFYVRAPTFDVPIVWNPTCESFKMTANMAKRIEDSRLCDVEFDPRVLIPKAKGQHRISFCCIDLCLCFFFCSSLVVYTSCLLCGCYLL
ncbi:PREDICTED: uncharacterized protein LOC105971283 [Erythranthe guttata]|uniref:uncharacterized protein LOC105971283 n=1 Tax=Erythranthe guttata TaxID=4155 RepID=UPI00064DFAFF|nr:PREDICTED: uncharacterized protein LOC105971283 [Erythranthe guttata]|eukprot:XP_012851584.1 PREDICTED: uncharacterized protein LOC105971283 [Erythranthe guttata]